MSTTHCTFVLMGLYVKPKISRVIIIFYLIYLIILVISIQKNHMHATRDHDLPHIVDMIEQSILPLSFTVVSIVVPSLYTHFQIPCL